MNGANVNARDDLNVTPPHFAVIFSSIEVVRLLLKQGADITAKDYRIERHYMKPSYIVIPVGFWGFWITGLILSHWMPMAEHRYFWHSAPQVRTLKLRNFF